MATTVVPPAATPAAPTSISDAIDALPLIAETGETPESAPEGDAPEPPPEMDAPTVDESTDTPTGETPSAPPAAEEEIDPADPMEPDNKSPDGKKWFYSEAKGRRLMASYHFQQAVESALGPDANVDAIKGAFERSIGIDQFLADYDSGDPQRVGTAADWFLDEATNPQSIGHFADHIMATVAQKHPQVYSQISGKVLGGYVDHLYRMAGQQNNEQLYKLAQNLDFQLNKRFRTADQMQQRDPLAEERAAFNRERDAYNLRIEQDRKQVLDRQVKDAEMAVESARSEEIAKAIPPQVKTALEALPDGKTKLNLISIALNKAVEDAAKANQIWEKRYEVAVQKFRANPSAESRDQLANMMRQFVAQVVAKERNAIIRAISGETLSANAAAHAHARQLAAKREPVGASASPPRTKDFNQQMGEWKKAGMSSRDALEVLFGDRR